MNRRRTSSLSLCLSLILILFLLGAGVGLAQTADGSTPAEETVCDPLSGAAFGLCNAYCEAMDCELLFDGDDATMPNASERACMRVKDNFIKITGLANLPCENVVCPDTQIPAGCPCDSEMADCLEGLICDENAGVCVEDPGDPEP